MLIHFTETRLSARCTAVTLARVAHSDERFADLDLDGLSARAEAQERTLLKLRATAIVEELELTG